jgi:2-keto-4-pentenoate hydratase
VSATRRRRACILKATDVLERAGEHGVPTVPVRTLLDDDVDAAYAVQAELRDRRIRRGGRVVGRKIGLTSPAVQRQLGVDQPDFGILFADMQIPNGGTMRADRLLQPKVEAEIAFLITKDLVGHFTAANVPDAVGSVMAALEIVDSRIAGWDIDLVDTVADNGSAGLFVLGGVRRNLADIEPKNVRMRLTINGEMASAGSGSECLGDPMEALLWLARTAQQLGDPIQRGEVVLSGALGPMAQVAPGDEVQADLTELGAVAFRLMEDYT